MRDLAGIADDLPSGLSRRPVTVNGQELIYNAYKFGDGSINVGRITVGR